MKYSPTQKLYTSKDKIHYENTFYAWLMTFVLKCTYLMNFSCCQYWEIWSQTLMKNSLRSCLSCRYLLAQLFLGDWLCSEYIQQVWRLYWISYLIIPVKIIYGSKIVKRWNVKNIVIIIFGKTKYQTIGYVLMSFQEFSKNLSYLILFSD